MIRIVCCMNEFAVGDLVVDPNGYFGIIGSSHVRYRKSGVCGTYLPFEAFDCLARCLLGR